MKSKCILGSIFVLMFFALYSVTGFATEQSTMFKICNIFEIVSKESQKNGVRYLSNLGFYKSSTDDYKGSIDGVEIIVSYMRGKFWRIDAKKEYSTNNYQARDDYEINKEFLFKRYKMRNVQATDKGNWTDTVGDRRNMCMTYWNPWKRIDFQFMNNKGSISYGLGNTSRCTKYGTTYDTDEDPSSFDMMIYISE